MLKTSFKKVLCFVLVFLSVAGICLSFGNTNVYAADNTAPTILYHTVTVSDTSITPLAIVKDINNDTLACSLYIDNKLQETLLVSNTQNGCAAVFGSLSPSTLRGTHTAKFVVTDNVATPVSVTNNFTVTIGNLPKIISYNLNNSSYSVQPSVTVQDTDNDNLTCRLYLDGVLKDTKTVSNTLNSAVVDFSAIFKSTLASGTHSVKVEITDGNDPVSETKTFLADVSNTPPQYMWYDILDKGSAIQGIVRVLDVDGDTVTCNLFIDSVYKETITLTGTASTSTGYFSEIAKSKFTSGMHTARLNMYDGKASVVSVTWQFSISN